MRLSYMQPKFEIDKQILEETKHCHGHYKCLDDYLPKCGEIIKGIESVICGENVCGFCYYKLGINIDNPVCMCLVRKEIYRKYKK